MSLSNSGARWVTQKNKHSVIIDKIMVKNALKYLMNKCYFTIGDQVFCLKIGIPMRLDPAPFMANIFLFYFEYKWMKI